MIEKRSRGRPIGGTHNTELAKLRGRLNISQEMAAEIAAGLLGECHPRTWKSWEAGKRDGEPIKPPPVILAHFRRLVATLPPVPKSAATSKVA